jgi:hypothetical protein
MKACGGVAVEFHAFLSSALDRDEWPASSHMALLLKKEKNLNICPNFLCSP